MQDIIRYELLQMDIDNPCKFMGLSFARKHGGLKINMYKKVYSGILLPHEIAGKSTAIILETLFMKFNADNRPNAKTSHSLSVSDVVKLEDKYWFCNDIGWVQIQL